MKEETGGNQDASAERAVERAGAPAQKITPSNSSNCIDQDHQQAIEQAKKPDNEPMGWRPDAHHINALPGPVRSYIHMLETRCDPSGDTRELVIARETCRALAVQIDEAAHERRAAFVDGAQSRHPQGYRVGAMVYSGLDDAADAYQGDTNILAVRSEQQQTETCICAAIQLQDGRVFNGHRHDGAIEYAGKTVEWQQRIHADAVERAQQAVKTAAQGFTTSTGRFVDRYEGMRLQREAGKTSAQYGDLRGDMLFSEDLY